MEDVETNGEMKAPVVDSTVIDGEAARKLKHPVSSGKKCGSALRRCFLK